jgi:hypothetical protein
LKNFEGQITCPSDCLKVKGIGEGILKRIVAYTNTRIAEQAATIELQNSANRKETKAKDIAQWLDELGLSEVTLFLLFRY